MAEPSRNAVVRFEPDGYETQTSWLMGRQVAGNGFLRGLVRERGEGPLHAYTATRASAEHFARLVHAEDPTVECRWIQADRLARIGDCGGVLYLADPTLPTFARARLRAGVASYALCGVTHTTATPWTMQTLADLLSAPVAPWDALVCTSKAVLDTVAQVHAAEAEMLRWRLGPEVRLQAPMTPVIPLGVCCDDFDFSPEDRAVGRAALGLADDEVAALFVGRLTFSGKHHPLQMYQALQAAAERTGRRLVLIQCGWAPNAAIQRVFETAPAEFAPDVRMLMVEGRDAVARGQAWAAADLFISLSDGIQETFGLTPVEAMAAGLPCVVSDWNGYRDTVRDGVDGFRIRTWAPGPGPAGAAIARDQEVGLLDYDAYLWAAAAATSVDLEMLTERLAALVADPELRRRMGEAGRARARADLDWGVVIRQYQALWAEQNARRAVAQDDEAEAAWIAGAPRATPARLDPFLAFAHYPTQLIAPGVQVVRAEAASAQTLARLKAHPLFFRVKLPDETALRILAHLEAGGASVVQLAAAIGATPSATAYVIGLMAKMGLVRIGGQPSPTRSSRA